jgi:alkylhydroperoxidase/carboxymuconolactone decarboxylase family protein YurZ
VGDGQGRTRRAQTRVARLLAAMRRERGYIYPEWEWLAREAPEFLAAYEALYRAALASDGGLPVKYRELVALGILAFRGESQGLVNHIRRARQHGATRAEILGALQATIVPGGALTFLNGLRALLQVDAAAADPGPPRGGRGAGRPPAVRPRRGRGS